MNYLVNFKVRKNEFYFENLLPRVDIVDIDGKVWAEMPIGKVNPLHDIGELYLQGEGILIDSATANELVNQIQRQTKVFRFSQDKKGKLVEDEQGTIIQRLPLDVNIDDLDYVNGEILLLVKDDQEENKE